MEKKHCEIQSISSKVLMGSTEFFVSTYEFLSSLTSHPLFSITVAFYSLILLYFPSLFLNLIFSPVLISTGIIISTLLRLGTSPESENGNQFLSTSSISDHELVEFISCESEKITEKEVIVIDKKSPFFSESFFEYWNLSAPLDVIYEEHEGQEEDGKAEVTMNESFSCLGRYFPESDDTESESDDDFDLINGWDSPQNMSYRWEDEEDDKDGGLIEIELNDEKRNSFDHKFRDYGNDEVEEMDDNLIEIDIS